jgi:hypothetical protein
MSWRTENFEMRKRRSNAQHYISVRHDAVHLERILNEHGGEEGGRAVREHPVATDRRGVLRGETTLWYSGDLCGAAPTYEALIYAEMIPLVIFDLVIADRGGAIKSAIECVVSNPCSAKKRAFLSRINFPVYSVDASAALTLREDNVWLSHLFMGRTDVGWPFDLVNLHMRQPRPLIAPPIRLPQG